MWFLLFKSGRELTAVLRSALSSTALANDHVFNYFVEIVCCSFLIPFQHVACFFSLFFIVVIWLCCCTLNHRHFVISSECSSINLCIKDTQKEISLIFFSDSSFDYGSIKSEDRCQACCSYFKSLEWCIVSHTTICNC